MEQKNNRQQINKKYYEKNKNKRIVCDDCGKEYTPTNKTAHLKTKYHYYEKKLKELEIQ